MALSLYLANCCSGITTYNSPCSYCCASFTCQFGSQNVPNEVVSFIALKPNYGQIKMMNWFNG